MLCETLGVSRSAYYAWRQDECSNRKREDNHLKPIIKTIFHEHKRRYGARRIAAELQARQQPCGRKRIRRLMKEMGLVAIQPRSFKPRTTDSQHALGYSENLVLNAEPPTGLHQVWVGDITYIPISGSGFLYLAMLMDLYSRRIIGWELRDNMRETLVIAALQAAIAARQPPPGLVHHSDRGSQYASTNYRKVLARAQIVQSMSRAGNCYDNAFVESGFGTIKSELEMKPYANEQIARKEIPDYIRYYNTWRRHSALDYLAPEAFEERPT